MKKVISMVLVGILVFSLTACTKDTDGTVESGKPASDTIQNTQDNQESVPTNGSSDVSTSDASVQGSASSDTMQGEASGSEVTYEFEKAGLTDSILEYFRNMVESGPGAYFSSFYESYDPGANTLVYICENGDVVARFPDTGDMTVLTTEGGHFMYEFKDSEGYYTVTDFVDNLYEYFFNMSLFVGQVFMTDMEPMRRTLPDEPVYSSYREVVDMSAKKLLDASSPIPVEGEAGSLWLSYYKRFDGKELAGHLNTQYMEKRNVSYLAPLTDKIYSWTVNYAAPDLFNTDYILHVDFTDDITVDDMDALAGRISDMMGQPFDGSYNGNYSGSFVIYSYTEDDNTDEIEDSYTILYIGDIGIKIVKNYLSVTYMNLLGVDGGSFCNYAFKKDGLHRIKGIEPYTDTVVVPAE